MLHRARHGWIEVVAGVMFSGKSEELIRRVRRALIANRRVQLFKSHLDDRYGGEFRISSHAGRQIDAEPVSNSVQLAEKVRPATQVVAIDEAQFLDDGICEVADALADAGMRVIVAGTDMDFRGEPFGPMGLLLARADRIGAPGAPGTPATGCSWRARSGSTSWTQSAWCAAIRRRRTSASSTENRRPQRARRSRWEGQSPTRRAAAAATTCRSEAGPRGSCC